ncbi:hypothetical protein [Hymenobacter glacieicola]|uniref:Uncharacterized protein n=1 Tax=Hymenobacter glacieicola TaxID=1562124 RepID=A0ABQ1WIV9_9BACT|nr:hypothetical protein [Hymenobacter glacieicola]GGG31443.1 hypothetical protein GCM10011378_05040 [Hymenobacter glacieicola]
MRTFYSYVLAGWLLCAGAVASAAPVTPVSDGPGKPALVTAPPVGVAKDTKPETANQKTVVAPPYSASKEKKGAKKVWLIVGIAAALALLRILL